MHNNTVIILGINTAVPLTEISLVNGKETIYEKSWKADFNEAEKILPALKQALQQESSIDKVFIVSGPGSFTGLRVGAVIANTLSFIKNAPMIDMTTFEYLKRKLPETAKKHTVVILRAGGKNIAYMFPSEKKIRRSTAEKLDEIFQAKKGLKFATGDINIEEIKLPSGIKWLRLNDLRPMAEVLKTLGGTARKSRTCVKPVYLNPPQITKSKKQCFT